MRYLDNKSPQEVEKNEEKKMGLWRFGKKQYKDFTNYHVKKTTFIKTTIFGIIAALLVLVPFILLLVTFYKVYGYNPRIKILIVTLAWVLILIYNGLTNYYTVQCTKCYISDDEKLQSFDARAIAFYNVLNPWFMIFSFIFIICLLIGLLSC
ncbi:MAG: hypothetical protein K6E74_04105 [Bacilli bacterium]|nr:hypothetical protein [Bacilli bacterium]